MNSDVFPHMLGFILVTGLFAVTSTVIVGIIIAMITQDVKKKMGSFVVVVLALILFLFFPFLKKDLEYAKEAYEQTNGPHANQSFFERYATLKAAEKGLKPMRKK